MRKYHSGITNHKLEIPTIKKTNNPRKGIGTSPDQNIRPPFQENYAESSHNDEEYEDDINIVMGIDEENTIFLTQEDQELIERQQLKVESSESFDYKQGYEFSYLILGKNQLSIINSWIQEFFYSLSE